MNYLYILYFTKASQSIANDFERFQMITWNVSTLFYMRILSSQKGPLLLHSSDMDVFSRLEVRYRDNPLIVDALNDLTGSSERIIAPEFCEICGEELIDNGVNEGRCSNRHPWWRCMFTLKLFWDAECRRCSFCNMKALSKTAKDAPSILHMFGNSCMYCSGIVLEHLLNAS
jgi:hypothetical protein